MSITNSNIDTNPSPVPFVFDFTGNTLQANTSYFLRLTASGQGSGGIVGNNSGIDNLVVTGDFVAEAVPEPSPGALTMLGASAAMGFGAAFKGKLAKKKAEKA